MNFPNISQKTKYLGVACRVQSLSELGHAFDS